MCWLLIKGFNVYNNSFKDNIFEIQLYEKFYFKVI